MNDPIVEEVRAYRDEHSRSLGYSLDAICEEYKEHQLQLGARLVRLQPKKLTHKIPNLTFAYSK
jgi:hypothetical protein